MGNPNALHFPAGPAAGKPLRWAPRLLCATAAFPQREPPSLASAGRTTLPGAPRGWREPLCKMADGVLSAGVNLEAFAQAIAAIQALRSSVTRVFDCLKDGRRHKEAVEGREKGFLASFQESLHSVSRDLG